MTDAANTAAPATPATEDNGKPAATSINSLDQAIERYSKGLSDLESAENPSIEQIVEVLVARDAVEKKREASENPSGACIARLIELDTRLKDQAKAIATQERLREWKENLNIPSKNWWWEMKYTQSPLYLAIERYEKALRELESAESATGEQVLEVLLARDAIEEERNNKLFPGEIVKKVIELDSRLRAQGKAIATNERLEEWKSSVKPPATNWWWDLQYTLAPKIPSQAINNYAEAMKALEGVLPNADSNLVLEVLLARDEVEKSRVEQSKTPIEKLGELIGLDNRLQNLVKGISPDEKLSVWKNTLKPPAENWWWNIAEPEPLPTQTIERYEQAMSELESASPPNSEIILEVLFSRDAVESAMSKKQPELWKIEKIIGLDKRLKKQKKAIAKDKTVEEWKKILNKNSWWWQLTDTEGLANQEVERYEQAILAMEEAAPNPTTQQILEALIARDAIAQTRSGEKQPPKERLAKIIELDNRLWAQAGAIAKDNTVDEWKANLNPPASNWWWKLTIEAPYPIQALERYEKALIEIEDAEDPSPEQSLKLLQARDGVEKAIRSQQTVPERISKTIIELDKRLKRQRLILTKGRQLGIWKKSLNPPASNWWWDLKPTLLGNEDEPMPFRDRLWIGAAVVCLGVAAGFVVSTTQSFQTFGQTKDGVRADPLQNLIVILQGGGLLTLAGGAATNKGNKLLENLLTSIPFIRPSWQAPATFGLSLAALGAAYGVNQSLPQFGKWYFSQGQQFAEEGQLFRAQEQYLQAKKFFTDAASKAKLSLVLGKVYEQQGNLAEAIKEYTGALATDNAEVINRLGRAMLLEGLEKVGWTGKIADDAIARKAENYFQLVENEIKSGEERGKGAASNKNQPIQEQRLKVENLINQGILYWSRVDFNKQPLDKDAQNLLEQAREKFDAATQSEDELPTTPDGRNSRCYAELAAALIEPQKAAELKDKNNTSFCDNILNAGVNDRNEANMMSSILNLLRHRQPPTPPSKNTEPTQTDNSVANN